MKNEMAEEDMIPIKDTNTITNLKFISLIEDIDEYFAFKKKQKLAYILDIFENELETDDEIFKDIETDRFMYENESKFLLFFEKCFEFNNGSCIVDFRKESLIDHLGAIIGAWDNILDQYDKELFLQLLFVLKLNTYQLFEVRNKRLFLLIVKLLYRNMSCPPDLIFIKHPMRTFYNYGCNFLLTFEKDEEKKSYSDLAKQSSLYIRS